MKRKGIAVIVDVLVISVFHITIIIKDDNGRAPKQYE
jgi:hypothetical protein